MAKREGKPAGKQKPGTGKGGRGLQPPRGPANAALTAQTRRILGKHYAAKYGVRKERG